MFVGFNVLLCVSASALTQLWGEAVTHGSPLQGKQRQRREVEAETVFQHVHQSQKHLFSLWLCVPTLLKTAQVFILDV